MAKKYRFNWKENHEFVVEAKDEETARAKFNAAQEAGFGVDTFLSMDGVAKIGYDE